jgi:hypothetical protein
VEEPGQDLRPVLRRDALRELDEAGQVQPPVPERLDDLRVSLNEVGGGLPVMGGAVR